MIRTIRNSASTAALLILLTSTAYAAGPKSSYKDPSPGFNWSGLYIGVHAGYGWGDVKSNAIDAYDPIDEYVGSMPGVKYDMSGVIGGAQIGYNFQFNRMVLGVEADISASGIDGSHNETENDFRTTTKIEWLSTIRGRLGFVHGNMLIYGTGGVAIGSVKNTLQDSYDDGEVIITTSDRITHVGWTVGGGIEAALDTNWTLKAEYLYVDLGKKETNHYQPEPGWPRISTDGTVTTSIARVGLNYKF